MSRFIALIDMDCFYAQVDEREKPELKGKPLVVCQFSKVNNGMWVGMSSFYIRLEFCRAIAVNYQARIFGVKRGMTASEARTFCPHINVSMVPKMADIDKADLSRYRWVAVYLCNDVHVKCLFLGQPVMKFLRCLIPSQNCWLRKGAWMKRTSILLASSMRELMRLEQILYWTM